MQGDTPDQQAETLERKPVRVWQIVVGILLIVAGACNPISRPAGPMGPSNETQWMGYFLATAFFLIVGLMFVLFGTRVLPRKPD
ncbi:MAG TPA: hypothetical protein VGJ21_03535 [Terracidiphilus sp.]|jgi:hypothetical protein